MREFLVRTNFGYTYRWSHELIADDYASTAIQWQGEDDIDTPKTYERLVRDILNDEDFLTQWFNDYIRGDVSYSIQRADLTSIDQDQYSSFVDWCINTHGSEE